MALGTNKLSSAMGTTVSTARLAKHGFLKGKVLMAVCSSAAALMGSALGAHLALMVPESVIKHMMIVVLPVVAFYVLRNKDMGARDRTEDISRNKVFAISMAVGLFVGGYDGLLRTRNRNLPDSDSHRGCRDGRPQRLRPDKGNQSFL